MPCSFRQLIDWPFLFSSGAEVVVRVGGLVQDSIKCCTSAFFLDLVELKMHKA